MLIMRLNKFLCSIAFAILTVFFTCESASAQKLKWKRSKPETLYARNKKKDVLPIYIGIGTKTPSAQFHTIGTLRFEGLTINNGLNSVLAIDNSGNVFWKDMSNSNSNAWFLNGNTIGPSNFLGTTNDQDVRIRTNNAQRAVFTSSGLLGIGVTAPTAQLHSNGSVRFEGLANNDVLSRLLVMDNLGNLSWRNASSLNSNDWTLTGNNADANSFLGTINTENLRIKVNSAEKAVFTTGGSLGLGVTAPSAQLHTNGTIRFEGVSNNNTLQRLALFDNSGNLFYRDLASLQANFWSTTGNAGTLPATNYLGTTDNNRLVIRTNNVERMTVLADGKVGIGTVTPQTPLHVSGNAGILTGFPYEVAVFEKAGDTKLAVLSSDASGIGGASITLGHSNFSSGGLFPGYEMQYGYNNQRFLRFNYLPRNASGIVQGEAANILILTDNSRVGVNLGPTGGGAIPVFPTANFHTNGTVRFQGLQNGAGNPLVTDANGNVFIGIAGNGSGWGLTGNAGTSPATNYLGTTDNNRLVIRTNNVERMTVLADGKVGIGTVTPQTPLHVSGNAGILTGFPYEVAVFEKAGDTKLAVLSSDASGIGGASITLGHSNFSSGGLFPGYEMQYGYNNQRFLRFNYLPRNASGIVQGEAANILILTDNSRVGVNLGPTGGGAVPVFPTANFHTNGTVRFQGLQNGTGNALVVDANGNVFRSATLTGKSTDELQDEIIELKREMEELKTIVNSIKGGSLTINENNKALLYQNMPNPFSNTTTIRYYLPEGVSKAFIQVADLQGTLLKAFEIVDAGKQTVIVNGGELPAGTYLYSLFADNKLIDSKKMILTR